MKSEDIEYPLRGIILDFYRFYRSAKDNLTIKLLATDSQIIVEHGHKIIENPKTKVKTIQSILKTHLSNTETDWLIVGHIHRAFIDHEGGIASPGCWQLPPSYLSRVVTREDIRRAIIIEKNGDITLY